MLARTYTHLISVAVSLLFSLPLAAQIVLPTTEYLPVTEGSFEERSVPFLTQADTLASFDYVEDEYVFSGMTNLYDYVDNAAQSPLVEVVRQNMPYATRVIIRRPANDVDFNGTVYLDILNSTRGYDSDISWHYSSRMIMREGAIYVGLTSKPNTVNFLRDDFGRPPYIDRNYSRYENLLMRKDGQVWDMLSQAAALLKTDSAVENPLAGASTERVILTGYSQSAGYVKTYVNSFHADAVLADGRHAFDGYFEGAGSFASKVPNPPSPSKEFNPGGDPRNKIVLPVPAPVMRFQTETEVVSFFNSKSTRQTEDEDLLIRTYEMAGGAHVDARQKEFEKAQDIDELGLYPKWPDCEISPSTLPVEYMHSALLSRLDDWIESGRTPPDSHLLALTVNEAGRTVVATDADGNPVGGARLPQLDVPIGVWSGTSSELVCILNGSYVPFSTAELAERYPYHRPYTREVFAAVIAAYQQGFILPADGWIVYWEALHADIGKRFPWRWGWWRKRDR